MRYIFILLSLFLMSCSNSKPKELKIAVNSWIGYTPLFYAQEKGYLKEINIKLIPTVSLGESADIFSVAKVNMLAGTQHELHSLQKNFTSLEPIILIDRSNGGDMILSNKTIKQLQKSSHIDVYLEIDSINSEMIQKFTKQYHLNSNKMRYIDKDQSQIQDLPYKKDIDTIIVTYTPYDNKLEHIGFHKLASTKNIKNLIIIDAIYSTKQLVNTNKKRFQQLKLIIDKSIQEIHTNPKKAYKITAKYLNHISFKEYKASMKNIKWINKPSKKLLLQLEKINYLKRNLI